MRGRGFGNRFFGFDPLFEAWILFGISIHNEGPWLNPSIFCFLGVIHILMIQLKPRFHWVMLDPSGVVRGDLQKAPLSHYIDRFFWFWPLQSLPFRLQFFLRQNVKNRFLDFHVNKTARKRKRLEEPKQKKSIKNILRCLFLSINPYKTLGVKQDSMEYGNQANH